jgi:DNA-binding CsgD family transcriptional regulator
VEAAKFLLLITDTAAAPRCRERLLSDLFGLTPAEARTTMRLTAGLEVRDIAAENGVSPDSVRFQLKCVYQKSGVRRQSELVRLVSRLPGA